MAFSKLKELQDNSPFCDGFVTKVYNHKDWVNDIFGALIFLEFPFKNNKQIAPAIIEKCLNGLPIFLNKIFWLDPNSNTGNQIATQCLSLGSFFNCIFQHWFHGDLIQFLLKVLLQNSKNAAEILIVPHSHIKELLDCPLGRSSVKTVFENVHKNVRSNSLNRDKSFSHDLWLFIENVESCHWTCRFLFCPNAVFDSTDARDCFLMTLDKNKTAVVEDTVLFNKFVFHWMSHVWFLENDKASRNEIGKTPKDIEKVIGIGVKRFNNGSGCGGLKNEVKKNQHCKCPHTEG